MLVGPVYWDFFFPILVGGVVYIWIKWLRVQERGVGRIGVIGKGKRVTSVSPVDGPGLCVWWGEVM